MSRSSTPTIDAALGAKAVKMTARVTAYKSRIYFEEADLESTNVFDAAPLASKEIPLPEAVAWNTELGEFLTVFVDEDDRLSLCKKGGTPVQIYVSDLTDYALTDGRSRPGISF